MSRDHRSLPSPGPPIDSLPTEILIEVFVYCTTSDNPLAPLTLASVATYWREAVLSSPRIWQQIFLDDRAAIQASHKQAALWAQRSYPLTFDVHLDVGASPDLILPLLSPLLSLMDRWQHFTMTGKQQESIVLSGSTPGRIDPLVVAVQGPEQEDDSCTFSPTLSSWLTMNIRVSELPTAPSLVTLHFTSIVLQERSLTVHTQPRSILEFLSACPQLQTFFFTGWQHDDEVITAPLPVVRLPALHTLHLRSTCGARTLLSYIDAPSLTELYLSHLNVDFQFHHGPAAYLREPGDSADEAHDFSRSRWSDHATGMGLRRLLARSNPPLRVLDMDWSDMRTKDFRFVFARLALLEQFYIVASDMSNTVLELLRPFGAGAGNNNAQTQMMQVYLPRLRTLELASCNQLSGAVLVDVLSERVRATDKLPPAQASRLQQLTITECEGFTEGHAQMLRKSVGDRLRLDPD